MTKLLSINADAKTIKGGKIGYITAIQYLSPYMDSGVNLCPNAKNAKCYEPCLKSAGRMGMSFDARLNRTKLYLTNPAEYFNVLVTEITAFIKKAQRKGLTPLIRLNGTSDIRFENIGFVFSGIYYRNIFEYFPDLQFYDYTKIPNREKSINGIQSFPKNYDLTFSYSGADGFQKFNDRALKEGKRVAVVFDKIENIPVTFHGRKVVSGDETDVRHLDPKNVIVALYAKGRARKDQSGFVVRGA
tara:strand:+ start:100 stop:831 length:732 start_codon:yes stop_codon:yes gene_type:complete